jgi:hypothetical protein
MKSIFTYGLSVLLLLAGGCQKSEDTPELTSESCVPDKQPVKTVTDVEGIIGFHPILNQYYIRRAIPGTYDSVDFGMLCGTVPTQLQVVDKKVLFSGTYKDYDKPSPAVVGGQTFYYLQVSKARIYTDQ